MALTPPTDGPRGGDMAADRGIPGPGPYEGPTDDGRECMCDDDGDMGGIGDPRKGTGENADIAGAMCMWPPANDGSGSDGRWWRGTPG
ncbi:hypothetical protein H4S02_009811, partial [Coemansia sp. RSA 2611]